MKALKFDDASGDEVEVSPWSDTTIWVGCTHLNGAATGAIITRPMARRLAKKLLQFADSKEKK